MQFDGSGSSDPDGSIVAYDWDFGDGNSGTGVSPTHSYAAAGLYTVSLTVTDNAGATDTATTTAVIDDQPQVGGVTATGDVYATPSCWSPQPTRSGPRVFPVCSTTTLVVKER